MQDIEYLPGDQSKICFVDYSKLFFSSDGGKNWTEQFIIGDILKGYDLEFTDNGEGWLLTEAGIFFTNDASHVTVVKTEENGLPKQFYLDQNYPNPFNPLTRINFTITDQVSVDLTVYDIPGREIVNLVNEVKQAGTYEIKFNAGDLPSGIYFYRLKAGHFSDVKKMVLLE
ncbi:MAG: hypothetical protein Kow0098_22540 [Ignavibacteriaceae bacterium]